MEEPPEEGDGAEKEEPLSTDTSQSWLPEGCSPNHHCPLPPTLRTDWIQVCRRVSRWAEAQQRDIPASGDYAKWQVIAFLFKDNPFGKSFFLEDSGEMGVWVGTSEPLWVKRLGQSCIAGPSSRSAVWPHRFPEGNAWTGLGPGRCDCSGSESCRCRAGSRISTAACLSQGPPPGQA